MEYILLRIKLNGKAIEANSGLNPCFNGIYSFTLIHLQILKEFAEVLILVLMEYILLH